MDRKLIFVIPVYNDWESVNLLCATIERTLPAEYLITFILVNDSSEVEPGILELDARKSHVVHLELSRNHGHQKAIAIGLAFANENLSADYLIIMDSDGEDKPSDILSLIEAAQNFTGIVFAKRSKRSEGRLFRTFYKIYKVIFSLLTGKKISFGNFCLMPEKYLKKIVHVPDIWNHFSGGVIRSGIPYMTVPTERGKRYFGESKMNFTRLLMHGLSAISVYADYMAVRLIILSLCLIISTIIGIVIVAAIKFFTPLAVPGWATFTVLSLVIILFLALVLGLFLLFNVLTMKTQRTIIPAKDYRDFIVDVKTNRSRE